MTTDSWQLDITANPDAPAILDVAINGIRSQAMNPNVPMTVENISVEAAACLDAGASIIHVHNTSPLLTGASAAAEYRRIMQPVREQRPDVLWYPTLVLDDDASHSGVEHALELADSCGLEIGPLDPGSVNVGAQLIEGAPTGMLHGVAPERVRQQFLSYLKTGLAAALGIYEPGYLRTALMYYDAGLMPAGSSLNFYFVDEYGLLATEKACSCGLPPEPRYLDVYLSLLGARDIPWFVSVWGATDDRAIALIERALSLGGHVQIGVETYYHPDKSPTNRELLALVSELARRNGRDIAIPAQAREILGIGG